MTKKKKSAARTRKTGKRATPRPDGPHFSAAAMAAKALNWFTGAPAGVELVERHGDERGEFVTIANVKSFRNPIGAVAVVTRKAGYVFAEHSHAREGHIVFVASGHLKYREKRGDTVIERDVPSFNAVFSPPDVPHAFLAVEDSVCVVVANISRTQAEYEADVRRLPLAEQLFKREERRSTQAEIDEDARLERAKLETENP